MLFLTRQNKVLFWSSLFSTALLRLDCDLTIAGLQQSIMEPRCLFWLTEPEMEPAEAIHTQIQLELSAVSWSLSFYWSTDCGVQFIRLQRVKGADSTGTFGWLLQGVPIQSAAFSHQNSQSRRLLSVTRYEKQKWPRQFLATWTYRCRDLIWSCLVAEDRRVARQTYPPPPYTHTQSSIHLDRQTDRLYIWMTEFTTLLPPSCLTVVFLKCSSSSTSSKKFHFSLVSPQDTFWKLFKSETGLV